MGEGENVNRDATSVNLQKIKNFCRCTRAFIKFRCTDSNYTNTRRMPNEILFLIIRMGRFFSVVALVVLWYC